MKKREEDDSLVTDLEKRINDRQSTREAQKQDRIDKENAKIAAEKEAKEAKEAAEIAKKEQEAAKKADILSGESCFLVIRYTSESSKIPWLFSAVINLLKISCDNNQVKNQSHVKLLSISQIV